eukprot:TRINITY_DN11594_c0_g1_i1.p1 TRINITY_DN11594_c0_g1~~TRINITY_DN11594_c0_g1_i1.p1  ORF type:complete len:802 (-),score=245.62 TRINITY_DN11594_c0_g1_i1:36-2441(-)
MSEAAMDELRTHLGSINIPGAGSTVWKTECCYSFHTQDDEGGVLVDMKTWLCYSPHFASINFKKTGNAVYLKIKRTKIVDEDVQMKEEEKPTTLSVGTPEAKYDFAYSVVVLPNQEIPLPNVDLPWKVQQAVDGIIKIDSAEKKQEIQQWVDDTGAKESEVAKNLVQLDNGKKLPATGWTCDECGGDATTNLWLNLTDGHVGCGRQNWDGSGGKGHALDHYKATGYPLVVKLGTITGEGKADVHSYAEDDMVLDPLLDQHLKHWGLDMSRLEKTDKSMAEMEIEFQYNFDWSKASESNKKLTPLYGPGYTGLENLGNTCYMNSVMQTLLKVPEFSQHYTENREKYFESNANPTSSFQVQMAKLAHGILSGDYSKQPEGEEETVHSVRPFMFKSLIGKGHDEFSTNRQQDALEFLQHVFSLIERSEKQAGGSDPTKIFDFSLEERIQCGITECVGYKSQKEKILSLPIPLEAATNTAEFEEYTKKEAAKSEEEKKEEEKARRAAGIHEPEPVRPIVPLSACINSFFAAEMVQGWYSSAAKQNTHCFKQRKFETFPPYLIMHMGRFQFSGGELKKLDAFLEIPDEIDLEYLRSKGAQPGEKPLPDSGAESNAVVPDENVIQSLMSFDIPRVRAERAWFNTQGQGAEAAAEWYFTHMDDASIDTPLPGAGASSSSSSVEVDPVALAQLESMGFPTKICSKALRETKGNLERAADWLFSHMDEPMEEEEPEAASSSPKEEEKPDDGPGRYKLFAFVTHMGKNTSSGHYVAHILVDGKWVIYNDAKVAESVEPPRTLAYLYFFKRI